MMSALEQNVLSVTGGNMKKKMITVLAAVLFAGCGGKKEQGTSAAQSSVESGLLRGAVLCDITTMDVAETTDDYLIPMNIFERLFETRPDGEESKIENSLCKSYTVSEDGKTYDFEILGDVVFSNGNPLTASDVKYSFERLLTKGRQNTDIPLEVVGGEDLMNGKAESLAGFEVKDDTHFSVTLTAPNAGFIAELSSPCMSIVDEESTKNAGGFGKNPAEMIGSGPYTVKEWVSNDHYTLEYNPRYHGAEPSVKKVIMKVIPDAGTMNLMFQNGEIDLIDLGSLDSAVVESAYRTAWKDHIVSRPKVGLYFLAFNENNSYFKDVKVRQAIARAINVDDMITGIYNGDAKRENGIIPSGVLGYNKDLEPFAYDPSAAKKMLEEAGYKDGEIQFEFSMDSTMSSSQQLIYQSIARDLAAVGIKADIQTYDHTTWIDRRLGGKTDCYVGKWIMDYNDPANIMITFFGGESKANSRALNYPNIEIMDRVAKAPAILDEGQRIAEYQALEKQIVKEDAAWVPLVSELHLYCFGNRVKSFTPQWAGFGDFYVTDVVLG